MSSSARRGEIWLVSFDPSVGSEIRKTRPALVVSNDIANENNSKVTLIPITGTIVALPIVVIVQPDPENGLSKPSLIRVPDVTTFDKRRLRRKLGVLRPEQLEEVARKLRAHLSL